MTKNFRNKKIFAFTLIILCMLTALLCLSFGTGGKAVRASSVDDNYGFARVGVEIEVNKNKTLSVKETLVTDFAESGINTGIIRDIQRISRTTRIKDGKAKKGAKYIAKLSDVNVLLDGAEAKVTRSLYHGGEFHSIKMQTPSGYLEKGTHTFVLSYIYDMGDDGAFGYDDFTFDALGYAMNRTEKFTCKITFPQGTDLSGVTFRTNGKAGWTPSAADGESAEISGNVISVTAFPKAANKGYTVQVLLPKGYFNVSRTFYKSYLLYAGISLLAIAGGIVLFLLNVLNRKPKTEVVEYLPPEGLDIMHASAAWHRGARYKDICALILKWAGDGLLDIQKDGEKHLKVKPAHKFYDAEQRDAALQKMTHAERNYFEFLFYNRKQLKTFFTRTFKKQHATFKKGVYRRCEELVESGDTPKPVRVTSIPFMCLAGVISLIPSIMALLYCCTLNDGGYVFLVLVPFWAAGVFTGIMFHREKVILMLIFPAFFYGALYGIIVGLEAFIIYDYMGLAFIAPVWEVLCSIVAPFFLKGVRTEKAQAKYAGLYGFKKFLLACELPQMKLMFDERPDYFSEIMPYCFIMGISKKVQKRFAALGCALPPYWERGIDERILGRSMPHSNAGRSFSFAGHGGGGGGGSSGGGGSGGSSGGGGGGGGSRGC